MTNAFLKLVLIGSLLCIAVHLSAQKKDIRPNIIYIMADDLGYADLSCYGRKDYQTPNLDKLALQAGMKFTNAYAAAPVCTPTRVAFMTGRYPARTDLGLKEPIEWSAKDSSIGFSPQIPSMATSMKEAGYETFLVGKWHLGFAPQFSANKNGFDYFFGFNGGGIDYISHRAPRGGAGDLFENEKVEIDGYLTDILSIKANEVIRRKHEKPFFFSLMFNAPHWPWQGPGDKPYADTVPWPSGGSAATYATIMKSLDDAVGSIMKTIEEQKLADNTIIIFTSDNGGERFSDMGIYRGRKMQLWEGGIREPAFVRWPRKINANSTTKQVVTTMDWTATILALAGAKPHPKFPLDGINIMPVLQGKQKEVERTLYWRIFQRQQHKAMRDGKWKWMQDEKGTEYLIDLENDPSEKSNLKDRYKDIFENLRKKYQQWEATVLAPVPLGA